MIDRVEFFIYGGNGGNGAISFRREKFIPRGGPDGGDGGKGGSVILVGDAGTTTLSDLRHQKHYRAKHGVSGKGKLQHGKKGETLRIKVPVGTMVRSIEGDTEMELGDITLEGQELVVAKGGKGGWGNKHFATPVKQVPRVAKPGEPGQQRKLVLDLKLLADVGLVGKPNVGKSTLINGVSAAHSKVANYHFTTLEPQLGVVELGFKSFVVADLPGLIEGAHSGHGLGHRFLRHVERTRILIHLVDGTAENPLKDMEEINEELFLFNPQLREKPQILVINKIDLPEVSQRMDWLKSAFGPVPDGIHFISAATGEGLPELMKLAAQKLSESVPTVPQNPTDGEFKIFRPKPIK